MHGRYIGSQMHALSTGGAPEEVAMYRPEEGAGEGESEPRQATTRAEEGGGVVVPACT